MDDLVRKIYKLEHCKVKLTKKNGDVLIGTILELFDPEDEPELEWLTEEGLTIDVSMYEIFYVDFSEIADVECVE